MKRFICNPVCFFIMIAASFFGILETQKEKRNYKEEKREETTRKKLDKFYMKELQNYHLWIFQDRKDKFRNQSLTWWYEGIETTKEHMSKDGYNWQQIQKMYKDAEWIAKNQFWSEEDGYKDGFAGKKMNPERESLLNDVNGRNLHYHIGYNEGKKSRLNN